MTSKDKNRYLLLGTDLFLKRTTDSIIEKYTDTDLSIYYGDELNADDFFSYIFSVSMFGDTKIAIVKNSDKYKKLDILLQKSCQSDATVVIFQVKSKDKKKDNDKLKDKIKSLIDEKKFNFFVENFPSDSSNIQIVLKALNEKKFNVSYDLAKNIYEICGKNISIALNEIEKIDIYFKYSQDWDEQKILNLISSSKPDNIYDFIGAFFHKKIDRLTTLLSSMKQKGENIEILFYELSKYISSMFLYKTSPSLLTEHLYTLSIIKETAAIWNIQDICGLVEDTYQIDNDVKMSRTEIVYGLYRLISRISNKS